MKKIVIFDANPLVDAKTGIGYLTDRLVQSVGQHHHNDIQLVGHYFNFLGKKDTSHLTDNAYVQYIETKFFPTKLLNALRKINIELPIELFTRRKADVHMFTNFVSLPSIFKTKSVLFVHDMSYIDVAEFASDRNVAFLKKYVPRSIGRASRIITISQFSKGRIKELYGEAKKIDVLFVPPAPTRSVDVHVLDRFKLANSKYILFVGTKEPRKNLVTLLEAFPEIHSRTNAKLVIAGGGGWKNEELTRMIEKLQSTEASVVTAGYVSDEEKAALYENAALYVQPSHYEGFGMPILEAMSYGVPVLCSDIAVFHEVAGDSALYFKATDSSNLAQKACEVLENGTRAKQLAESSLERIKNSPTWQDEARKIAHIIAEI